jgi:hypothetical protein
MAAAQVSYRPPVDGPVVDPFRLPTHDWFAGNRGIDYEPGPGTSVRASADGEVVFAGQVGGTLHVVVLHADGIRTSYSFLQSIAVHRGDRVRQGQTVGASGERLHFGARLGDTYIDPRTLFDDGEAEVFLVPDEVRRPASEAAERSGLERFLGGVGRAVGAAARGTATAGKTAVGVADRAVRGGIEWSEQAVAAGLANKLQEWRGVVHYASELSNAAVHAIRVARTTADWWQQRKDCTPADFAPPPLPERRMAVLVGGIGSSEEDYPIDDLDTNALGYGRDDTVRFSYRGGTVAESPYAAPDTTVDMRTSARRLRELLERIHREHPGVPIDIIAHSQGGVVARAALAYEYEPADDRMPRVANLVTLGSPHQGADLATALEMVGFTTTGEMAEWAMGATGITPVDPRATSVRQLSEISPFLAKLERRPLPSGVRFTSIGARGDFIVPAIHTRANGGRQVVVSVPGAFTDHTALPGSEEARREVALAIAGRPPTCQTLTNMLSDTLVSDAIATTEDLVGAAAYNRFSWADDKATARFPKFKVPKPTP